MQLHQSGRRQEAEGIYRQILAVAPGHADALHFLGLLLFQSGQPAEGLELLHRAVAAAPHAVHFRANLAHALKQSGQLDAAIDAWRQTITMSPGFAPAYGELSSCLQARGFLTEAVNVARRAVELNPDDPSPRVALGSCLLAMDRADEAEPELRIAIRLRPNLMEAHNNLGAALHSQGRLSEAEATLRQAIALAPNSPEPYTNLGLSLHMQGRNTEGGAAFRRAIELNAQSAEVHSRLLYTLHHDPSVGPQEAFNEHVLWARRHVEPLTRERQPHLNVADPIKRLKIGYVSIDYRRHSVAYFLEPILAAHDRRDVEIYCYSNVVAPDDATARMRGYADQWRDIIGLNDAEAAQLVRQDGIDILVDLVGHTAGKPLRVFARKPAPIQMTYLGYPGTTGLPTIDYRLTDALADPPGMTERFHAEKLVRMPDCAWTYRPPREAPPVAPPPSASRGYVTFGSFNMLPKITPAMIELWAQILLKTPGSKMILKTRSFADEPSKQRVAAQFAKAGIDASRVELRSRTPAQTDHLADYGNIDIELDTLPYNGTTIICESLWMGVPVVSLAGQVHVSRVGMSLLSNVGLRELVATTPQEYVTIATELSANPARLVELRATMRDRIERSSLRDETKFARGLEAIYRMIWQVWCRPRSA
jgi:predicted O-linked N-acetylglucosamine transferase (SPINDLY family)